MATTVTVPIECPSEVSALLFQASRDSMILSSEDAAAVWKELVCVAACALEFQQKRAQQ